MKKVHMLTIMLSIVTLLFAFSSIPHQTPEVDYPTGYRNWTHVKSKVAMPANPDIKSSAVYHHIYANALALEGYKTGKFPNGSVIVADFIAAIDSSAALFEGQRKYIDVMIRNTDQYATTGGWGFEEFDKDSKTARRVTLVNAQKACFNCHKAQADNAFVFSKYRE
jgi:hypothetical protein